MSETTSDSAAVHAAVLRVIVALFAALLQTLITAFILSLLQANHPPLAQAHPISMLPDACGAF